MIAYTLQLRPLSPELVLLSSREHGRQLFARGRLRKAAECAGGCSSILLPRCWAWRPLTHARNRMHRLCDDCVATLPRPVRRKPKQGGTRC